ncbi:PREDICTED: 1-(5-phosphoribosyl)-5-[(5-phosphoribosylamino)methylideneamino] imidazole-4-carboxamide isomerase, chloroplastic-like [Camelina sativa]|uniref:1-(5-phosphoribosyl)-5-[(5- phosphoribosylamino)methylideneamino] imidazole-4-carboxamide isomerase, chloroplastic-like n=1 Tax=Camelina sativa TaxID=90675 RepID=A0ABM0YS99_CAMSA|nr:PREDICTED: 1-(5-phosphoribosyl)-5-[(5-phosphoribosylamino)methylideneamino] imidazole-4-carboxamide isomerase, chloroplastic-like [Camelina sativa]
MRTLTSQLYFNGGGLAWFQKKNQSSLFTNHLRLSKPLKVQVVVSAVQFRPCIDIHKGKVKQIVGSTLSDLKEDGSVLVTNFESDKTAEEYAKMYKEDELTGGHVIMLGADPLSQASAIGALHAYPDDEF